MKKITFIAALTLAILSAVSFAWAGVEGSVQNFLSLDSAPQDMAVISNGKYVCILTKTSEILVYSNDGKLQGSVKVGSHIDRIKAGPTEDTLLLASSQNRTVETLALNFIHQINTEGSPVKGIAEAPVEIVEFGEFE